MGAIATAFSSAFRDYNTDGVPASGNRNTPKSDARALGTTIEAYFVAPWTFNNNVTASPTSAPTGYVQRLIGKDADTYQMQVIDAFGGIPAVRARRANGTGASPTAIASGNNLGQFDAGGYYTSGGTAYGTFSVSYRGQATESWTSTAQGAQAIIATTPNGSTTPTDALYIGQDQSVLAKGALGYVTGQSAGSTVTQGTSRTTGVTINAVTGAITLFSAAGTALTAFSFTVTNSKVAATDTVVVSVKSATNVYMTSVTAVGAGSFNITVFDVSGTATDAPVINFAVIKGATN